MKKDFIPDVGGGVDNTEIDGGGDDLGCTGGEIGVRMDIIPLILVIGNNVNHLVHGVLLQ
jgi:hypothetical protein